MLVPECLLTYDGQLSPSQVSSALLLACWSITAQREHRGTNNPSHLTAPGADGQRPAEQGAVGFSPTQQAGASYCLFSDRTVVTVGSSPLL